MALTECWRPKCIFTDPALFGRLAACFQMSQFSLSRVTRSSWIFYDFSGFNTENPAFLEPLYPGQPGAVGHQSAK